MRKLRALVRDIAKVVFILVLSFTWIFGAWPQLFSFPPEVEETDAYSSDWYNDAWAYRQAITINAASVSGTSAFTDFPVLVAATSTQWKYSGFGGHVGSATGWDFVFTAEDGVTKLDHEIEYFASSTGRLISWVRVTSLSATENTVLYVYYGNASASDQQNKHGVWDSNFKGVWHMSSTSSNTTITRDSTTYSSTGTLTGTTTFNETGGHIDGAVYYDNSSDWVTLANESNFDFEHTQPFTLAAWTYRTSTVDRDLIFAKIDPSSNERGYNFGLDDSPGDCDGSGECVFFDISTATLGQYLYIEVQGLTLVGGWHHIVATYDGSSNVSGMKIYVDGSAKSVNTQGSGTIAATVLNNNSALVGGYNNSSHSYNFLGTLDEVHVSNTARTGPWIATEYNNQSSPSTFLSFRAEEAKDAQGPWYDVNWLYRNKFTISAANVAGAATSFPVLINSTREEWRDTTHSGNVGSATGWDFVFTSSDGFTKLDHEVERFASSTGELVAWVRVPFLSSTSNTVLYAYYGGPTTTDQQNLDGTWNANYKAVYHMKENPASNGTPVADSSGAGLNGSLTTDNGGNNKAITGQVDGAFTLDNTGDWVDRADDNAFSFTDGSGNDRPYSVEGWFYLRDISENAGLIAKWEDCIPNEIEWILYMEAGIMYIENYQNNSCGNFAGRSLTLSAGAHQNRWLHVVATYSGSETSAGFKIYIDGSRADTTNTSGGSYAGMSNSGAPVQIGAYGSGAPALNGDIDNVRILGTELSASWIATEYANQSSPETFYSIDASEPLRGANASNRTLTLSDSRPSQPANHTFNFTVSNSITASTTLVFEYPTEFSFDTGEARWYNGSWQYRQQITIDAASVSGTSALADFPVLVAATSTQWKYSGFGGHVGSATGWDFVFTAEDGVTKLDHEREYFASTTGRLISWVRVPSLSPTSNTVLYAYYGNTSATDQQNKHGVWDANFKGVWHMSSTTTNTLTLYDSTAGSNTGTKVSANQPFPSSTGTIDGAQDFNNGTDDNVTIANESNFDFERTQPFSISVWIRRETSTIEHDILEKVNSAYHGYGLWLPAPGVGCAGGSTSDCVRLSFADSGGGVMGANTNPNTIATSTWQYIVATYDGSSNPNGITIYVNGTSKTLQVYGGGLAQTILNNDPVLIGDDRTADGCCEFNGGIDEVRISNVVRTGPWIATEYNNQSSPDTFSTVGAEQRVGVDPAFNCADVDVATGTEFILGISSNCAQTATTWGVTVSTTSRTFTITSPSSTGVYVATGTEMTVRIGTNAGSQEQGNSKIINPSTVGTYRVTLSGTAGSSGDFRVSINGGLTVEAFIPESLSFSVSSIGAASCTADDGASITSISTNTATVTPPLFIQEAETAWGDTDPKATASFSVQAGDVLVAYSMIENGGNNAEVAISSSQGLSWTQEEEFGQNNGGKIYISLWTTTVTSNGSLTVTFDRINGSGGMSFGGNVLTFRGSGGVGASSQNNAASGAPTLNITTTQENSAIVVANGDWNAGDGSSRIWRTNAGAFSEQTYAGVVGSDYIVYGGYHGNAGPVNTYAVGLSTPSGQDYSIVAVEVKGSISSGGTKVPFGTINANTFYQGCHDLQVSTNAGGGYSLAAVQNHQMQTAGGTNLADTTCDAGTCTASTAATWTTATNNGLGHTCNNRVGNDCVSNYGDGLYFRQFADEAAGEMPVSIMASTTPAIATGRVEYRLSRGSNQAAGSYTNTISYSVMATY